MNKGLLGESVCQRAVVILFKMAERVNESQIKYILDYMSRNKHVLRVICAGPKSEDVFKIKWAQLAKELNSLGPPVKTVVQWQKVWRYLSAIMKTIRNRSRLKMKKISSLIPQSMIYGMGGQDLVTTVGKGQFSRYMDSDIVNLQLTVSHRLLTNDDMKSLTSNISYPHIFSLVSRKNRRTVQQLENKARLNIQQNYKSSLKKSPTALQNIMYSFSNLYEYF